jgi:hypothetical protein
MAAIRDGTRSGQSDSQYITQEVRGLLTIPNEHLVVAQKDDVHLSQVDRKDEVALWFGTPSSLVTEHAGRTLSRSSYQTFPTLGTIWQRRL